MVQCGLLLGLGSSAAMITRILVAVTAALLSTGTLAYEAHTASRLETAKTADSLRDDCRLMVSGRFARIASLGTFNLYDATPNALAISGVTPTTRMASAGSASLMKRDAHSTKNSILAPLRPALTTGWPQMAAGKMADSTMLSPMMSTGFLTCKNWVRITANLTAE